MTIASDQPSLRFLLVEDDTVAAIELECILEDLGNNVGAVAVAPRAALNILSQGTDGFDAVIFGAMLIGLPTYSLAREIARTGVPAIVSSDQPETVVRALGFTEAFLAKPFTVPDVCRVVAGLRPQLVVPAA